MNATTATLVRSLHAQDMNDVRIGRRIGITANGVRWYRAQMGLRAVPPGAPLAERFWRYVSPEPNSGCWLWTGVTDAKGYGVLGRGGKNGGTMRASHAAVLLDGREVPRGLCACHRCDMPACVNPDHLFVGSQADNLADMDAKGRRVRGEKVAHSKLTAEDVFSIRSEVTAGRRGTQRRLARRLGISEQQVSKIVLGCQWKHLPESTPMERQQCTAS